MSLRCWMLVAALVVSCRASAGAGLASVPPPNGHFVDAAHMLDVRQVARIDRMLTDYEVATGTDIAVLTVHATAPEAIKQFSIRVAESWHLGRRGQDDGVLLVVAPDNPPTLRRLRIETGRGVQGILTDAQANRILQDVIAPHFREQQYDVGLRAGLGAIASLLHPGIFHTLTPQTAATSSITEIPPELVMPPPETYKIPDATRTEEEPDDRGFPYGKMLLFLLVCIVWSAAFTKRGRGRLRRGEWPESVLCLPLLVLARCDWSIETRSSGGGNADSGRRSGTFDGGGASGNW